MNRPTEDEVEARLGHRARSAEPAGPLFEQPTGAQLRDEGAAKAVPSSAWFDVATSILRRCARERETFASDDVRELAAKLIADAEPAHPNAWGAVFLEALRRGEIEKTGASRPSRRPEQHATQLPVYRITPKGREVVAPPRVTGLVCSRGSGCVPFSIPDRKEDLDPETRAEVERYEDRAARTRASKAPAEVAACAPPIVPPSGSPLAVAADRAIAEHDAARALVADVPFPAEDLAKCTGCDATIGWVKRADTGRPHPVEAKGYELAPLPAFGYTGPRPKSGYTVDGVHRSGVAPSPSIPRDMRFVVFETHFAHCPKAARFDRRHRRG